MTTKDSIGIDDYIELAGRTDKVVDNQLLNMEQRELLHASLGLVTEAGEIADIVKRNLFYGKPIDKNHLIEEIGDLMWYVAKICRLYTISLGSVLFLNIKKLIVRFPDGFTEFHALNRDLSQEDTVLNKNKDS